MRQYWQPGQPPKNGPTAAPDNHGPHRRSAPVTECLDSGKVVAP